MNTDVIEDRVPTRPLAPAAAARFGSRRRRLWELPAAAHDLLLAMSLSPVQLRAVVERCLSRVHSARCRLSGNSADVLYSSVRDLGTRNPLSEALQAELDHRHAAATRAMAGLRDAEALRASWIKALAGAGANLPAALWALLTHPLGGTLEEAALVDARAWVFAQARVGVAANLQATRQNTEHAEALADNASLRARLTATQAEREQQLLALRSEAAQLRGALQRAEQALQAAAEDARRASAATAPEAAAPPAPNRQPKRSPNRSPAPAAMPASVPASVPVALAASVHAVAPACRADLPDLPDPTITKHPPPPGPAGLRQDWSPAITGQRVLCVGGMPGAQRRYQAIVEGGGGRFAWHDGGLEDNVQRLDQHLHSADLVVCQAGCLNHEAYRRIKGHCKKLGKPCLYLQRPSLSSFARSLGLADGTES